jgi:pectate lyase
VSVSNVVAVSGSQLVGINENFGDTATIDSSVCATDVNDICATYNGTDGDEEPEEVSTGPSDYCIYTEPIAECA